MDRPRRRLIVAVLTIAGLWGPWPVWAAATARVVTLADLTLRAEEVAISSRHLTLIHFEQGDVSMVAVGDPTIVSVTVRGPDVLLKALVTSGSTNAFIWQASRYTQWTLVVRQDSRDARLIIVKDAEVAPREDAPRAIIDRSEQQGKTSVAASPAPPASPPPSSAQDSHEVMPQLGAPSLIGAQGPGTSKPGTQAPVPLDRSAQPNVALTLTPRVIDGQLFLYYLLENKTDTTLLTDVLRLRIFDRSGHRLAFGLNRVSATGHLGRLAPKDIESGVIALGLADNGLIVEWTLGTFGSTAQQVLRQEVPAP